MIRPGRAWLLAALTIGSSWAVDHDKGFAPGAGSITPDPMMDIAKLDPATRAWVDHAVADLARRLSIDTAAVSVQAVRAVVWPDRSLGCPRPGMAYPQVPQDGLLITLRAAGRDFAYHAGGARLPFLCESGS